MLVNAVFSEAARCNILLRIIQRRFQLYFTQVMIVFDFHHHKAFFAAHGYNGFPSGLSARLSSRQAIPLVFNSFAVII